MSSHLPTVPLLALLALPVSSTDSWRNFPFDKTSTNKVVFDAQGMHIRVDHSASFSLHKLSLAQPITKLSASGSFTAFPTLKAEEAEGVGHNDDFVLRVGLIFAGDNRLSWWSRQFAPRWIVDLSQLDPEQGIEKIHYYQVAQRLPVGTQREISARWHLQSTIAARPEAPGPFRFEISVDEKEPCLAVWVQADGDDTSSTFAVTVERLELQPAPSRR